MSKTYFRKATTLAASLAISAFAVATHAEPSNKWRIELDHSAQTDGAIVLRISPVGGTPIEVETKIPAKTSENRAASLLSASLKTTLGKGYHVEVDDGEDVLIKRQGDTPNFELTLVSSSVTGLTVELERE
ncbi:MAG TPA: hypothetical protein PKE27_14950 [Povalibacter sp.]|uniref:hypothetical protein n=1 Tax=Povalibacter sp. TaxID=1962978 RepID=UPI002C302755|nr:hypothetical protein [Povalibacter sp.]HMN45874.1 hypothetical protein [Povalibacter sp.]